MKKIFFFLALGYLLSTTSCNDDINNSGSIQSPGLDQSFKFQMKSFPEITIKAINELGEAAYGVQFSIYLQNPYHEDGDKNDSIKPIYTGYTEESGTLTTEITVPNGVDSIYVVSDLAGYGPMQTSSAKGGEILVFSGVYEDDSIPTIDKRLAEVQEVRKGEIVYPQFNGYSFYFNSELESNGIPKKQSELVSTDNLSTDFKSYVKEMFPESKTISEDKYLDYCSDLHVTDENGAEIWVTYIGDGGFSNGIGNGNVYNTLCYYQYKDTQTLTLDDGETIRKTVIFPNTNPNKNLPCGHKVQLLYWDEENNEYVKVFPKGTRIGFVMIPKGYNQKNTNNQPSGYNVFTDELRFSTPVLNRTSLLGLGYNRTQGIIRWCEPYDCCVLGIENKIIAPGYFSDMDFNDVLVKITSNPIVKPEEDIPIVGTIPAASYAYGTLAFEDLWPYMGDYDFNDYVVAYQYCLKRVLDKQIVNRKVVYVPQNKIKTIEISLDPKAIGAGSEFQSAFAIQLPIPTSNIDTENLTNAKLEPDNDLATFIIYENTRDAFPGGELGYINTHREGLSIESNKKTVIISLKEPIDEKQIKFTYFNPFIYVGNNRGREIHLVDYAPTSKADVALFRTGDDKSYVAENFYYRANNAYPWALDVPRISADAEAWRYPLEKVIIVSVYKNYAAWVLDKTDYSWFENIEDNVVEENLY